MPQELIMIYNGFDSVTEYSNKVERFEGKVINKRQRFLTTDDLRYAQTLKTTGLRYERLIILLD